MLDKINADCRRDFYPALRRSGSRALARINLIPIHCTQSRSAASTARYFQTQAAKGSAHLVVDDDVCQRCLPNSAVPWAAPGANTNGFHIELAGRAEWTTQEWMQRRLTILRAAYKTAYHCHLFGIPPVWLTVADLRARKHGITSHANCSKAYGGDHTDPGAGFPVGFFMAEVTKAYARLEGV